MNTYSANVEVDSRKQPTDADIDRLMEQLAPFHAAVGMSPAGLLDVQMHVVAETLPQAAIVATSVVEAATGTTVVALELMTEAEFDRRQGFDSEDDLVTVPQAAELLGVSRQAVGQRVRAGTLPAERRGRDYWITRRVIDAELAQRAGSGS